MISCANKADFSIIRLDRSLPSHYHVLSATVAGSHSSATTWGSTSGAYIALEVFDAQPCKAYEASQPTVWQMAMESMGSPLPQATKSSLQKDQER